MEGLELVKLFLVAVIPCIALGTIIWRLAAQFSELKEEINSKVEMKVAERNNRLDNMRAEYMAKIERCNADIAIANRELAQHKLEVAKYYAEKREVEKQFEHLTTAMQLQVSRLETTVDKLLGRAGQALLK